MPYFCIIGHNQLPIVRVEVKDRKFKSDQQGFFAVHTVHLETDSAVDGAHHTIAVLDEMLKARKKHTGIYHAPLKDVIQAYEAILASTEEVVRHSTADRIAAGVTAALLFVWVTGVGTVFFICWMVILAFRQQSGLMAAAETSFLWSTLFSHRQLFKRLVEIALGRR